MDEHSIAIAVVLLLLMGLVERYAPGRPVRPVSEEPLIRSGPFTRKLRLRALARAATGQTRAQGGSEKRKRNPGNVWEREQKQSHPLEATD